MPQNAIHCLAHARQIARLLCPRLREQLQFLTQFPVAVGEAAQFRPDRVIASER